MKVKGVVRPSRCHHYTNLGGLLLACVWEGESEKTGGGRAGVKFC